MKARHKRSRKRSIIRPSKLMGAVLAVVMVSLALVTVTNNPAAATSDECTWAWERDVPQSHQEYKYKQPVVKTKYQYQKETRTKVKHDGGAWEPYGNWSWWSPPSYQWSFDDVEVLEGPAPHGTGTTSHDGHTDQWYREYRYVKNGVTEQVNTGQWEYSDWTTEVRSAPWVKTEERTVQDTPIHQGPVRSANEPDRGDYPNLPWTKVPGSEECPDDSENKIEFCHANNGNGYNKIETSKAAFYVGHREHADDIYPAGSYTKGGQTYSWDAQGDQSLLQYPDCTKPEEPEYYLQTSHQTECGAITITLRNVSPWVYPVSYSTDGSTPNANGPNYGPVVDNRGAAPDDQTKSKTLNFTEDQGGGTVTVKYVVAAGTESDLYRDKPVGQVTTVVVDTDCETPPKVVEPPKPVWTDPCGLNNGSWSYEDGEGYRYDETVNPDGSITVTIVPEGGYTFPEGFKTRYTKKDSGELCPVAPLDPTVTQAECTGPGQSTEPSITPADGPEQIDYEIVGQTVIASVNDSDYEIVLPDGSEWVLNPDGTATYNVVFEPVDCTVEATPVAFDVSQPTCNTDGQLTIPEQPTGVMVIPEPGTYGPGNYEVIFSALEGYVLTDNPSGVINVLAATGYQDEDPKAACYVERKPDKRTTSSQRESCKLGGVETTTTVHTTTWEFNENTQKWESVKTATSSQSFEPYTAAQLAECDKEPPSETPDNPTFDTGLAGDEDGPAPTAPYGLIALLMLGLVLVGSPCLARIRRH